MRLRCTEVVWGAITEGGVTSGQPGGLIDFYGATVRIKGSDHARLLEFC